MGQVRAVESKAGHRVPGRLSCVSSEIMPVQGRLGCKTGGGAEPTSTMWKQVLG